jgi:hypothetical protein
VCSSIAPQGLRERAYISRFARALARSVLFSPQVNVRSTARQSQATIVPIFHFITVVPSHLHSRFSFLQPSRPTLPLASTDTVATSRSVQHDHHQHSLPTLDAHDRLHRRVDNMSSDSSTPAPLKSCLKGRSRAPLRHSFGDRMGNLENDGGLPGEALEERVSRSEYVHSVKVAVFLLYPTTPMQSFSSPVFVYFLS